METAKAEERRWLATCEDGNGTVLQKQEIIILTLPSTALPFWSRITFASCQAKTKPTLSGHAGFLFISHISFPNSLTIKL
jgi:hypothetical protein